MGGELAGHLPARFEGPVSEKRQRGGGVVALELVVHGDVELLPVNTSGLPRTRGLRRTDAAHVHPAAFPCDGARMASPW